MCPEPVLNGCLPAPPQCVCLGGKSIWVAGTAGAHRGARPQPSQLQTGQSAGGRKWVSRVLALALPPGSQVEHFSAKTQGPQTPAGKSLFLQGEPLAVRQPLNRKGSCELLGRLWLPSPAPVVGIKGLSTGVATWVLLRPALFLEGPVLEETCNSWSVKRGKKKRLAWFPSSQ